VQRATGVGGSLWTHPGNPGTSHFDAAFTDSCRPAKLVFSANMLTRPRDCAKKSHVKTSALMMRPVDAFSAVAVAGRLSSVKAVTVAKCIAGVIARRRLAARTKGTLGRATRRPSKDGRCMQTVTADIVPGFVA
jgi:hypothetical protein